MATMTEPSTTLFHAPRLERLRARRVSAHAQCQTALARRNGLDNVSCHSVDGKVVISGKVRSFYLKQLAQEILRKIDGIGAIENRLEVT
ncbi:MAG: hypothetical protein DCC68_25240 [Planctomycetota bacterium]|nr:MAG: hypothetical protein DCC68_25240 [Planctomycetota bacterium]